MGEKSMSLRLVDELIHRYLHIVATVMRSVVELDLITPAQGRCLGVIFLGLLATSITLYWFAEPPTPPPIDDSEAE